MSRTRFTPRPTPDQGGTPFASCEEAWFWTIETYENVRGGARVAAGLSAVPRPCDPRDVLGALARLYRARRIARRHVDVLHRYGRRQRPPDPRLEEECGDRDIWDVGLRRLAEPLRRKGIVEPHEENKL